MGDLKLKWTWDEDDDGSGRCEVTASVPPRSTPTNNSATRVGIAILRVRPVTDDTPRVVGWDWDINAGGASNLTMGHSSEVTDCAMGDDVFPTREEAAANCEQALLSMLRELSQPEGASGPLQREPPPYPEG